MVGMDRGGFLKDIDVLQESLRILLIEGNPQDTLLIKTVFSFFPQLEIFEASNLSEGIKSLGRRVYDLVLLDLFLPDSEGIETLDSVLKYAGQVPVAVFSELEDEDLAIMAFEKGAQDFLSKSDFNARNLYRFLFFLSNAAAIRGSCRPTKTYWSDILRNLKKKTPYWRISAARTLSPAWLIAGLLTRPWIGSSNSITVTSSLSV
jgi:DNA-binding response OmpR family regulator